MTIAEMMNNPLMPILNKNFPFYIDNNKIKEQFAEKFYGRFYLREIAFETPYIFSYMLNHRLAEIMPYYEQLYLTEWQKTGKDMMNQKDLVDEITHTLKSSIIGDSESNSSGKTTQENKGSSSLNVSSSSDNSQDTKTDHKESMLSDGVSQASLSNGYLTGVSGDTNQSTSSQSSSGIQSSNDNNSSKIDGTQNSSSSSTQQTILEESTKTVSHGDVGIQTPAYAITEWRKIIINIDQMILDDLEDLFLKIY